MADSGQQETHAPQQFNARMRGSSARKKRSPCRTVTPRYHETQVF